MHLSIRLARRRPSVGGKSEYVTVQGSRDWLDHTKTRGRAGRVTMQSVNQGVKSEVSTRYIRLMDLMRRPEGCGVEEASRALGVTPGGCRGMIRDLKRLLPVETVYESHGGRGRGRRAVHYVSVPNCAAVK
jgi:hypothetical protein